MRLMPAPGQEFTESTDNLRSNDLTSGGGGWRAAANGAGLGILWGVAMRAWMRFISTNPEFSWSGTMFILGASAIAGGLLAFARHRRSMCGIGWWRATALSLMLLGAGGAVMWPGVILGAIAIGRRHIRWLAIVFGLSAALTQIPVLQDAIFDNRQFGLLDQTMATVIYLPLLTVEAWAFSVVFSRSREGSPRPGAVKRILIWLPAVVVSVFGVVTIGLTGM